MVSSKISEVKRKTMYFSQLKNPDPEFGDIKVIKTKNKRDNDKLTLFILFAVIVILSFAFCLNAIVQRKEFNFLAGKVETNERSQKNTRNVFQTYVKSVSRY